MRAMMAVAISVAGGVAWSVLAATGASALAAPIVPVVATANTRAGVDAWQRGDYAIAIGIWRPLADGGDADAAFDLAQAYKLGRGVTTDLAQAKAYYGKAARAGHSQGAANYGLLLFQDGDRKNAMPWIEKASTDGDPRAQYVFGTALFNGDLATKDWPRAYALMTRAAAAGLPQATTSLAQMDQYMSAADRQKGLTLATRIASLPAPPIERSLVVAGGPLPAAPAPTTPRPQPRPLPMIDGPLGGGRPTILLPPPVTPKHIRPTARAPRQSLAAAGGKWRVQLGAYGSEAGAKTAWSGLAGRLRGLAPSYEKAGAVVRLRAGPLADKAAAAKACATVGTACFPVVP